MSRLFSVKPLVWALTTGFAASGSLLAAPSLSPAGEAVCHAATLPQYMIAPPQGSGEAALPAGAVRVNADGVQGQSQTRVRAEGKAIVERDALTLNADWVDYDQRSETLKAGNQFTLSDGKSRVVGEALTYNLATQQGEAQAARFESESQGRRLQGVGDKVKLAGKDRYRLEKTRFNTCDPGDDSWYIKADSIDADYDKNIGVARHAQFVFGGVPLLYTPWIDFPLNGDRKSGLLAPLVKIGSDGFELSTPYYFNLAPNYDATIRPHFIGRRGLQLGGEFRYLQPGYRGSLDGEWLPDDRVSQHANRYRFNWQHRHQISASIGGGIDFHQVSDDDYYRDLMGSSTSATVNLNRQLWLNHNAEVWGGRLSNYFTVQRYQTLASTTGYKDTPYALMPRVSSQWSRYFNDTYNISVFAQGTYFSHKSKQEGSRVVFYPSAGADFHNNWGFVRPKLGVHATYYDLNNVGGSHARSLSRVLPVFSIGSGVTFERLWRFKNHGYIQTLEPRLFYAYIPRRAQNDLPLFDASENSFTYEQLFRENRFSGQDRINAANFLTTALQTRLYDDKTGAERLSAGIGQRFYFNRDDVLLDGSLQKNVRNRSDILAFASGNITDSTRVEVNWHHNQSLKVTENFNVGVRYNPAAGKTASMRYKFGRFEEIYDNNYGKVRQIDVAVQWPIRRNYYIVARQNYDLTHSRSLRQLLGVEYQSPCRCWSASVVGQRYVTGLNQSKNAVFFQLQLRDLTSVGNNPFEQLRKAIPGYSNIYEVKH